ncbi:MAG: phage baseplate assembly protein V [Hydrogenovibrio crunogenus]|nr:phage baseplate assembly protein V [Hydrogenovibrio crunogenus]
MLREIANRLKMLFSVGTPTRVETDMLQIRLATGITNDKIKRLHNYGFLSRPVANRSKAYTLFMGGDVSRGVAFCVEDKTVEFELQPGEVAMKDDKGNLVHFTASGIQITTANTLTINASQTVINSPTTINGATTINADTTINGKVTNSGGINIDGIEFGSHTHQGDSGGTTGTPQ